LHSSCRDTAATTFGIKEIKLLGREQAYLDRFHGPSVRNAKHQGTNQTLAEVPKYLIEGVAFGGILALALYLHSTRANLGEVLPVLGLYAFAGYRLMPAAQTIYQGVARLRFGSAVIDDVYADLHGHKPQSREDAASTDRIVPRSSIALRDVNFAFPGAERPALKGMNLEIPVGAKVGIVGTTGSGKTTTVDLILGLLRPTEGGLMVDDQLITASNLRAWQRSLGYVPQEIFLNDATVAQNIAFGIPVGKIDHSQVERAARMAELHDFVTQEMPEGYHTMVGERGVRLSGGQRQRIGIARALYHQPEVLILDEATSALDGFTENIVMEAVHNLGVRKTVILVAHRLSTVVHATLSICWTMDAFWNPAPSMIFPSTADSSKNSRRRPERSKSDLALGRLNGLVRICGAWTPGAACPQGRG
jgi:ABC-type multidrug transport system fused ATPase/permease subunit